MRSTGCVMALTWRGVWQIENNSHVKHFLHEARQLLRQMVRSPHPGHRLLLDLWSAGAVRCALSIMGAVGAGEATVRRRRSVMTAEVALRRTGADG